MTSYVNYKVKDKLVSLADKDASHGAKSDYKRFAGHKANSMISEEGFIANIIVTAGNTYDGDVLVPLVNEKIDNSSKPGNIGGDTCYAGANNRYEIHRRGITVVAPLTDDFNPTWLVPQTKFSFENSGVTCPAGNRTMTSNYNKKTGNITYFFKKDICQQCILKEQCTKQTRRTVTIGKHFELVNEAREYNMTTELK